MEENKGIIKSKNKIIKNRLDIIIYEIIKYWGENGIRKYALINEAERIANNILPDKRGWDTIRKRVDKLVKDGILIKEGNRKKAVIKINPKVEVDETVKPFAEEVKKIIKLQREKKSIINELRVKHTEKIKERVIRPWIMILSKELKELEKELDRIGKHSESFKIIEEEVYYKDLDNHIPPKLENPKKIKRLIDEKEKEYRKLKEYLEYLKVEFTKAIYRELKLKLNDNIDIKFKIAMKEQFGEIITKKREIDLNFDKILKSIEDILDSNIPFEIMKVLAGSNQEQINRLKEFTEKKGKVFKDKKQEFEKKLKSLQKDILMLKRELLNVLKELEAYEILPGVCKYLTGGE